MNGALVTEAERLRELVNVDPRAASDRAQELLDSHGTADLEARARFTWVIGLAMRETGRFVDARAELTRGVDAARASGNQELAARIVSSLALAVAHLGELDEAVALLRAAEAHVHGSERARVEGQLGTVLYWKGELAEASRRLTKSAQELAAAGDFIAEARYRGNLGAVLALLGDVTEAESQLHLATELAERLGLDLVAGAARHNLGYVATLRGDLPGALDEFTRAESRYRGASAESMLPRLHADHAQALADAALFDDADGLVRTAIESYRRQGQETELAGTLLTSAEIRLAQHDLTGAVEAARDAGQRFASQGRSSWAAVARGLELQARAREPGGRDATTTELAIELADVAEELERHGWSAEATRCRLVAARLQADSLAPSGAVASSLRHAVERARPSDRILLAHVDALNAVKAGDRRAARRAVSNGLEIAMSSQAALGSIETRAHAAVHGSALTVLGARLAVEDGRPRELLMRIEATRLLSSRLPDVRPPVDPEMAAMLTELRGVTSTIADPSSTDEQRRDAEHARVRVERDVRRRSRAARGDTGSTVRVREELGAALALLGDHALLAHAALDGRLHAVSVVRGRARLHDLGSLDDITDQLDGIAFSLHRLNRSQGSEASRTAAAEMLYAMTEELGELLLPAVVADSMDPVVVVPTAVLHDVPWGLLPPLGGRAVSVNPSVSAWARAERTRAERERARHGLGAVGFMAGPGLAFAELEVENLASIHDRPELYIGPAATGGACIDLLGRADLVHVACHGHFRTDNPMFSALHLADGPLIVHDLERLDRLPETVVLPACSVANTKALQGGTLLGLASALTTLGACNVIAPLTPINDAAAVVVMQRLHQALVSGSTPSAALAAATLSHDLTDPTAGAFICLGA